MRRIQGMHLLVALCLLGCDYNDNNNKQPDAICGNGVLEAGEACDSDNFGGLSCESVFTGTQGNLVCTPSCQIDFSKCEDINKKVCGNGEIEEGEADGASEEKIQKTS